MPGHGVGLFISASESPYQGQRQAYGRPLGLLWSAFGVLYTYLVIAQWHGLADGTLVTRLEVFGGAGLLLSGAVILPRLWKATVSANSARPAVANL